MRLTRKQIEAEFPNFKIIPRERRNKWGMVEGTVIIRECQK